MAKTLQVLYSVGDTTLIGLTKSLTLHYNVTGSFTDDRFFPNTFELPKPGQWVGVRSQRYGIPYTLCQISNVKIQEIVNGVYSVTVDFNKTALKQDILLARLLKRRADLIEDELGIIELLNLLESVQRNDAVDFIVLSGTSSYSNFGYSDTFYSEE